MGRWGPLECFTGFRSIKSSHWIYFKSGRVQTQDVRLCIETSILLYCQKLCIFLAGALCICFRQQFFKSQAKGRHAFDPKNAWVNASGGSCLKEFFHVFAFPPLVDFATLFMVTVSPSDHTFFFIPSSTRMRYHRQTWWCLTNIIRCKKQPMEAGW